jgi:2-keto-4-pentenoate hydratase/2-oxohepta-3-ene-1,7-dioic acid hydratase in catechol pathway
MKIGRYKKKQRTRVFVELEDTCYDFAKLIDNIKLMKPKPSVDIGPLESVSCTHQLIQLDPDCIYLNRVAQLVQSVNSYGDEYLISDSVINGQISHDIPILPVVLYGIGGNSPSFFRDKDIQIPAYPRGFMRPVNNSAIIPHGGIMKLPSSYRTVRSSAELAIVINKSGSAIPEDEAANYYWGYTLVNDTCSDYWKDLVLKDNANRDITTDLTLFIERAAGSYYSRATDSFCAIGPVIVPKQCIENPYNLALESGISGLCREKSHTCAMVNSIDRVISTMSKLFTLKAGMVFHLGTMGIDGHTVEENFTFKNNDTLYVKCDNIGELTVKIQDDRSHAD